MLSCDCPNTSKAILKDGVDWTHESAAEKIYNYNRAFIVNNDRPSLTYIEAMLQFNGINITSIDLQQILGYQ